MRADGRRVKDMNSMYHLIPQFLTRRWDSMNMITVDIPLDPIKEYKNKRHNCCDAYYFFPHLHDT